MRKLAATTFIGFMILSGVGCKEKFSIQSLNPPQGTMGGGDSIVIQGTGFNPNQGVTVYFDNSKATNVMVDGPERMIVSTPSLLGNPRTVDVRIATDDGKEFLLRNAFRYTEKAAVDIRELGMRKSRRERPASEEAKE